MTALRHDVRVARDRIRAGQGVLDRFRSGNAADHEVELGRWLDLLDRTGDLPRVPSGNYIGRLRRAGGFRQLGLRFCLSQKEATAFCLLLTALTGENFAPSPPGQPCTTGPTGRTVRPALRCWKKRNHRVRAESGLRRDVVYEHASLVDDSQARVKAQHSTPMAMQKLADQHEALLEEGDKSDRNSSQSATPPGSCARSSRSCLWN